eukprot:4605580-Amphidinium_carterae.2
MKSRPSSLMPSCMVTGPLGPSEQRYSLAKTLREQLASKDCPRRPTIEPLSLPSCCGERPACSGTYLSNLGRIALRCCRCWNHEANGAVRPQQEVFSIESLYHDPRAHL